MCVCAANCLQVNAAPKFIVETYKQSPNKYYK